MYSRFIVIAYFLVVNSSCHQLFIYFYKCILRVIAFNVLSKLCNLLMYLLIQKGIIV